MKLMFIYYIPLMVIYDEKSLDLRSQAFENTLLKLEHASFFNSSILFLYKWWFISFKRAVNKRNLCVNAILYFFLLSDT